MNGFGRYERLVNQLISAQRRPTRTPPRATPSCGPLRRRQVRFVQRLETIWEEAPAGEPHVRSARLHAQ